MDRLLGILREEGLDIVGGQPSNLDYPEARDSADLEEHRAERVFERPNPSEQRIPVARIGRTVPSILRYFLDGSRKTYKVCDVVVNNRYLPVVGGQVGVAVMERDPDGQVVRPLRDYCSYKNVLALPGTLSDEDVILLQKALDAKARVPMTLLTYDVKNDRELVDLGVARIMRVMQDIEIKAAMDMAKAALLNSDAMLVIDGPLRFKEMRGRVLDVVSLRNVVGLSKSFRPSFPIDQGKRKREVGVVASKLRFGERTPVFETSEGTKKIGMWYMRMRSTQSPDPLRGVIKMECYAATAEDQEQGLDAEMVNIVSGFVLSERNVTPYGVDHRWPTHIYPIYCAETYLKRTFISDIAFRELF